MFFLLAMAVTHEAATFSNQNQSIRVIDWRAHTHRNDTIKEIGRHKEPSSANVNEISQRIQEANLVGRNI